MKISLQPIYQGKIEKIIKQIHKINLRLKYTKLNIFSFDLFLFILNKDLKIIFTKQKEKK